MAHGVPKLVQVVLDSRNPRMAAEFWRQLLGLTYKPGHEKNDPAGDDWLLLLDPSGGRELAFQLADTLVPTTWPAPEVPQQLHLDLIVPDIAELDAVHDRVLSLGGQLRQDRRDDPEEPLRVYTDPDGHTFCVFVSSG
jgi:catechol 2,3-dioxygenase-like lactoylglutathione lyase family enzyme